MKKRIRYVVVAAVAVAVAAAAAQSYAGDVARQEGLQFGVELEQIQDDIKQIQTAFYSNTALWTEGDLPKERLLESYEEHLEEFADIIARYDGLSPPAIFEGSVDLLRISSEAQMESDSHYAEWVRTGDESARIRSDALLQESLDYEMLGLAEFYAAKSGVKEYDREQFAPPRPGIAQRVADVAQTMLDRCDADFGGPGPQPGAGWQECVDAAREWRDGHLP